LAELLKLVNTLLDFSRIEAGRVQAVYAPTDLGGVTSEIAGVFRSAMENAGLQFSVECPPIAEPVYVDRDMWEKVVSNLRSNAFKFTFEGSVTVTLKSMESAVQLQVRDTGGFPRSTESASSSAFIASRGLMAGPSKARGLAWPSCEWRARLVWVVRSR
jgi:signal transduction histidine kinase